MWRPLFAGTLLVAIAVAIIPPTFYAVDPWLNEWMRLCGRSRWRAGPVLDIMSDWDRELVELSAAILRNDTATKVAPPRYVKDIPQPIPEQIMIANAPNTVRNVEAFRSLTRTMTMADVVRRCGVPDEHQGSGIYIFIYHLKDRSVVAVGTVDLKGLLYVSHFGTSGKWSELLPKR